MESSIASNDCMSVLADLSTIAACVTAVVALGVSAWQFVITQKSTQESQAVELFSKFNQLNIDQGMAASKGSDFWYNNSKFAITESLYEIAHRSLSWRSTIKWMLSQQNDFIREGGFEVDSYSKEFRAFCEESGYELKAHQSSPQAHPVQV